jgi:hypothetical protein
VTQADFISETMSLMDGGEPAEVAATSGALPTSDPPDATDAAQPTARERLKESLDATIEEFQILLRRLWIVIRDKALSLLTPDAKRRQV